MTTATEVTRIVAADGTDWSWLAPTLCDPESRPVIQRPWQIEHSGVPLLVATNGHALVMVPGEFSGAERATPDINRSFASVLDNRPETVGVRFSWPEFQTFLGVATDYPSECSECEGTGKLDLCDYCDGEGSKTCTCSTCDDEHETECWECDGRGHSLCTNCRVDGSPLNADIVRIGEQVFNAHMVRPLAWRLRGESVIWRESKTFPPMNNRMGIVIGEPWTLLWMPMRLDRMETAPPSFPPLNSTQVVEALSTK